MKRTIIGLLSVLCFSILLTGCDKDEDFSVENNCVTVDGKVCYMLGSAFSGGGVVGPNEGSWHVTRFFENKYSEYPQEEKSKVVIEGFNKTNIDYIIKYTNITRIFLRDIPEIGDLGIPLNRGVYEGNNEIVESVIFSTYEENGYERKNEELVPKGKSKIHIKITLKNSKVIEIKYSQKVFNDGLYY